MHVVSAALGRAMPMRLRDPIHRLPGCWYVQGSRMLQNLADLGVGCMTCDDCLVYGTMAPVSTRPAG